MSLYKMIGLNKSVNLKSIDELTGVGGTIFLTDVVQQYLR